MTAISGVLSGWFGRPRQNQPQSERSQDGAEGEAARPEEAGAQDAGSGATTGATTGGGSTQEPVVVWEAANRMEAEIVAGRLKSQEIPAVIHGEALGPIYGLTTGNLARAKVLVPGPLADKARCILETDVAWDAEADEAAETGLEEPAAGSSSRTQIGGDDNPARATPSTDDPHTHDERRAPDRDD